MQHTLCCYFRTTFKEAYFPVGVHSMMTEALVDSRLGLEPYKNDFTGERGGPQATHLGPIVAYGIN